MKVITKKYKLETGDYLKLGMINVIQDWWWAFLVPLAIAALTIVWPTTHWFWISALIITIVYLLFWAIQFSGVTQLEQFKILFERLTYEIDSSQILIKMNPKQGMPIKWDQVQRAKKQKNAYLIVINKAQLIHLPFRIFKTDNEIKFVESILKRKGLVK